MFSQLVEIEMRSFVQQSKIMKNIPDFEHQLTQKLRSHLKAIIKSTDLLKTHCNHWSEDKKQECLQNLQSSVEQINNLIDTASQQHQESTSEISKIKDFQMHHSCPQVNQVFEFIEVNYHQQIKVDDIAKAVGYSPTYLTDLMRRQTGQSLYRWITHRRMIEACRLLSETDQSIEQIAEAIGYQYVTCFFRQFRLSFKVTPQVWRKENRL
jgi:AraC-like DNA-binding protein